MADAMNKFDVTILHFLNQFSRLSPTFDSLVVLIAKNDLLRGGVIVVLFWWAWANSRNESEENRVYLLYGLAATLFSTFFARGLAVVLPYRDRPLRNPSLNFKLPLGMNQDALAGWSSFPSDHAALFVCLSVAIWLASKRVGAIALGYTFFFILLPRLYLGIHYPTDILVGALLGIGVASTAKITWLRKTVTGPGLCWLEMHPASFYSVLFLCTFSIVESFASLRELSEFGVERVYAALHSVL